MLSVSADVRCFVIVCLTKISSKFDSVEEEGIIDHRNKTWKEMTSQENKTATATLLSYLNPYISVR